ncbi:MAG TPA: hypothetical protein EYO76_13335 [Flavobacteriaceae bacterium]|nr:hypothetical protein [Flavobacteriaceae bacterium]
MNLERKKFIPVSCICFALCVRPLLHAALLSQVICHNLSGYDANFILQGMKKRDEVTKFTCLPQNTQRFRCFTINRFRFIDSMAFLTTSLASLGEQLRTSDCEYKLLRQSGLIPSDNASASASESDDDQLRELKVKLLGRKGVYPYDFCESDAVLKSTKSLPPIESFYNSLAQAAISEEDYAHAQNVWNTFGITNMLEYTKLYCLTGECAAHPPVMLVIIITCTFPFASQMSTYSQKCFQVFRAQSMNGARLTCFSTYRCPVSASTSS